jgi:hypothetical protein
MLDYEFMYKALQDADIDERNEADMESGLYEKMLACCNEAQEKHRNEQMIIAKHDFNLLGGAEAVTNLCVQHIEEKLNIRLERDKEAQFMLDSVRVPATQVFLERYAEKKLKVRELSTENQEITTENEELRRKLAQRGDWDQAIEKENWDLAREYNKIKNSIKSSKGVNALLKNKSIEFQGQLDWYQDQQAPMREEIQAAKEDIASMSANLKLRRQELANLNREIEDNHREYRQFDKIAGTLRAQNRYAREASQRMRERVESLEVEQAQREDNAQKLDEAVATLEDENVVLMKKNSELVARFRALKVEQDELEGTKEILEGYLSEKEKILQELKEWNWDAEDQLGIHGQVLFYEEALKARYTEIIRLRVALEDADQELQNTRNKLQTAKNSKRKAKDLYSQAVKSHASDGEIIQASQNRIVKLEGDCSQYEIDLHTLRSRIQELEAVEQDIIEQRRARDRYENDNLELNGIIGLQDDEIDQLGDDCRILQARFNDLHQRHHRLQLDQRVKRRRFCEKIVLIQKTSRRLLRSSGTAFQSELAAKQAQHNADAAEIQAQNLEKIGQIEEQYRLDKEADRTVFQKQIEDKQTEVTSLEEKLRLNQTELTVIQQKLAVNELEIGRLSRECDAKIVSSAGRNSTLVQENNQQLEYLTFKKTTLQSFHNQLDQLLKDSEAPTSVPVAPRSISSHSGAAFGSGTGDYSPLASFTSPSTSTSAGTTPATVFTRVEESPAQTSSPSPATSTSAGISSPTVPMPDKSMGQNPTATSSQSPATSTSAGISPGMVSASENNKGKSPAPPSLPLSADPKPADIPSPAVFTPESSAEKSPKPAPIPHPTDSLPDSNSPRDYVYLVNGDWRTGTKITSVAQELNDAVDAQKRSWRSILKIGNDNPKWYKTICAEDSIRCAYMKIFKRSFKQGGTFSHPDCPRTACNSCSRKSIPCIIVVKGHEPIVLPLSKKLRTSQDPTQLGYYVKENNN